MAKAKARARGSEADDRACVPNFGDVISNAPFLLSGTLGLLLLRKTREDPAGRITLDWEKQAFFVVFLFIFLTAIGSAYYHWEPSNATLFWDRLPMGVVFMALFAIVIGERLGMRLGGILLWPLIFVGLGSVVFWHWTETRGSGDIRPYALVQFFPMLAMPFLLLARKGPYSGDRFFIPILGFYLLAKILEATDREVFALTGKMVSGHTLKHVAAAVATYWIYRWFRDRRVVRHSGN